MLVQIGVCGTCGGAVHAVPQWERTGRDPFLCRTCGPIPLEKGPVFNRPDQDIVAKSPLKARQTALSWWKLLSAEDRLVMVAHHYRNPKHPDALTGSEIERMWKKENHDIVVQKQTHKSEDDSAHNTHPTGQPKRKQTP